MVHVTDTKAMASTKALEHSLKRYDANVLDMPKNKPGEFTGTNWRWSQLIFFTRKIIRSLNPKISLVIYLKELEMWGAAGITTWSSLLGLEAISAFHYMDQKGMSAELPCLYE